MMADLRLLEVSAAVAACLAVGAFIAGLQTAARSREVSARLARFTTSGARPAPTSADAAPDRAGREIAAGLNRRLTRSSFGASVQVRLTRAGLTLKPSEFILVQVAAACLAALAGRIVAPGGIAGQLAVISACAAVGFFVPRLWVSRRAKTRVSKFEQQLPQAIEAMAGTLQAGSTLPQSMAIISRELPAPLSDEFRRLLREMELGLTLSDSLDNLVRRVPSDDLLLLGSAISIQNRVGGDLAEILRSIAHTIRERLRIRGDISVLTAQGRYSTYLITGLPVLLFLYLYFTKYDYASQLFLPGITRLLLGMGIAGVVIGFYAMRRIIDVDV